MGFKTGFDPNRNTSGRPKDSRIKLTAEMLRKHHENHVRIYDKFIEGCLEGNEKFISKFMDTHFMKLPTDITLETYEMTDTQKHLRSLPIEVLEKHRENIIKDALALQEKEEEISDNG